MAKKTIKITAQKGPQWDFLGTEADICIYGGAAGGGKAMPLSEPVLTPKGFVAMGKIKVGSEVRTPDNGIAKVIQIHPQGKVETYRVKFVDGAETVCTEDHLWFSKIARSPTRAKVRSTAEIRQIMAVKKRNVLIPLCSPVDFNREYSLKIKPYTFGVMLGDGCLCADVITITKNDTEIFDRIRDEGYTLKRYYEGKPQYTPGYGMKNFSEEKKWLTEKKLRCRGHKKYIPEEYKYASVKDRFDLIQGLMDTDGYADKRGHCSFSSTSKRLAKDVQWIIRSLGGKATITSKIPVCTFKDGTKKKCRRAYIVYIQTPDNSLLFSLPRKKKRCEGRMERIGKYTPWRRIVSIEKNGPMECQCITLDSSDGLYITRDFIVTHNSYGLLLSPLMYKGVRGFNCTIFRRSFKQVFSPGGLWDTARSIYSMLPNAEMRKVSATWEFLDRFGTVISKIAFAHIENYDAVNDWQGSQLCEICCEADTDVLMGDGSYKKVRDIAVGDHVSTLQGQRRITAVGKPREEGCVLAELPNGENQVHTADHEVLTKNGWMSYDAVNMNSGNCPKFIRDVVVQNSRLPGTAMRRISYKHPYDRYREMTSLPGEYAYCTLKLTPVGKKTVISFTVDDCNHYITKSGLVNKNCFDELTHFSRETFFYMLSRNRSTCGVKPFIRATCNPDADSWVADFISWWIDQDTGYPIPERSGKMRWFIRRDGGLIWADTKEELWEQFNLVTPEEKDEPRSVTFIMSSVYDNKELLKVNPQYLSSLKALPEVERERLLKGNWKIKPSAGMFFKRSQIGDFIQVIPKDVTTWVRCWDLAATEKDENGNAAYTAGVLIGKRKNGRYIVADVINKQISASEVRALIRQTAQVDRSKYTRVRIRLPQDPGQAGKEQAQSYIKWLSGFDVTTVPESGSKESRAEPAAAQWQAGNFDILIADWNDPFIEQLENFPEGKYKDMVDALSNGFSEVELRSQFNVGNLL